MKKALMLMLAVVGVLSFVGCAAGYDSTTCYYGYGYGNGYGYNGYYDGYGTGNGYGNGYGTGYNNGYGMGTYNNGTTGYGSNTNTTPIATPNY